MIGYIYILRSNQTEDVYYGSTDDLSERMRGHCSDYKIWLKNNNKYVSSYEIIKFEDWYFEIVEEFEYNDDLELIAREGFYIRNNICVNKRIAGRTPKEYYIDNKDRIKDYEEKNKKKLTEYRNQYRLDNADKIKEYKKQYSLDNADKISIKKKENITCVCGVIIRKYSLLDHLKSQQHQKNMM